MCGEDVRVWDVHFIIQLIFLQQYFSIPVPRNIMIVILLQSMCLNSELLGTLCEKKHDATVVMDNKYFITLISMHIVIIAIVGCIFICLRLENTTPTCATTRDIAH